MERQRLRVANTILKEKNKFGRVMLPNFKVCPGTNSCRYQETNTYSDRSRTVVAWRQERTAGERKGHVGTFEGDGFMFITLNVVMIPQVYAYVKSY